MYSPHTCTGCLGTPFLDQSTDSAALRLFSEIRQLSAQISAMQNMQGELVTGLNKIEARVKALENLPEVETRTGGRVKKTAAGSKGGANEHPSVKVSQQIRPITLKLISPFSKPLVYALFYEMCGVDMSGNRAKRTAELCAVKELEDDLAFELVDGKEIWHPRWKDKINDEVNAQFLKEMIKCIYQNEEVSLVSLDDRVLILTFILDAATSKSEQRHRGDQGS